MTRPVFKRAVAMTATCLLAGGALAVQGAVPQQPPQLPEEVKTWMARNQAQRWTVMLQRGETLFAEGSCARCHGEGGTAGRFGPDLTDAEWVQGDGSLAAIRDVIFWGVRRRDFADSTRRFEMNPSGGMDLSFDDVEALTAYVWNLSKGTEPRPR